MDVSAIKRMLRGLRRLYEQELRAITVLLGYHARAPLSDIAIDKLRVGLQLLTDAQLRGRVKELDIALTRLSRSAADATRAHESIAGALDDVQIQAVMRTEFLRAAHTYTDEEWRLLDEVRAVRKRDGARAAMITARNGLRRIARAAADGAEAESDDEEHADG